MAANALDDFAAPASAKAVHAAKARCHGQVLMGAPQQSFAMSLESRAKLIGEVACDIAFAGNPDKRRAGVRAAALEQMKEVDADAYSRGLAHAMGARTE